MRLSLLTYTIIVILFAHSTEAKRASNYPYAQALPSHGRIYARCIPEENDGDKGSTEIFRVRKGGDELVDKYDWYNKRGIRLGWSPTVGKIAIMRFKQEEGKEFDEQIELSFYLGGELLKTYTTSDLIKLGACVARTSVDRGPHAEYKPIECRQVPGTNDYYFRIELGDGTVLRFNVLNGRLCRIEEKKREETKPSHTTTYTDYRLIDIE